MRPEFRFTLTLLALALAAFPAWLASRIVAGNLAVLTWNRIQGVVVSMAADDHVEVELRGGPDPLRVNVPLDHQIGISFLKKVPIYVDPVNSRPMRMGGLFQMWLWPTGLVFAATLLLTGALAAGTIGRGHREAMAESAARWMFSPHPPPLQTDIRLYYPARAWKMLLFWSLLGAATLSCGLFMRSTGQIPRILLGSLGTFLMLLMSALAWDTKNTEISADQTGMLKITAFGWCRLRWEQVGSVSRKKTIFEGKRLLLRKPSSSITAREVTSLVFADRSGQTLMSMSVDMEPGKTKTRLLDLCKERTGLWVEDRRIYEPNL